MWLKQDAESDRGIIAQMEKTLGKNPVSEALIKKNKNEMVAKLIVADKLDRTETMNIGG